MIKDSQRGAKSLLFCSENMKIGILLSSCWCFLNLLSFALVGATLLLYRAYCDLFGYVALLLFHVHFCIGKFYQFEMMLNITKKSIVIASLSQGINKIHE